MRLGVSYNYFNGDEHLVASLRSIRPSVDFINVVTQHTSNSGEKITPNALRALRVAQDDGLIDDIIVFEPDLTIPRQKNELQKRRLGLKAARNARCSHFFTMDSDEFYRKNELDSAKAEILKHGYTSSSVTSYFHIRRPIYRAPDTTNVAFISRLRPWTRLLKHNYPCENVDQTRQIWVLPRRHFHFPRRQVAMYHMNFVRRDLSQKMRNSSTVDKVFLDAVEQEISNWKPGSPFIFPRKGEFRPVIVENEFSTYDPDLS